MEQFRDFCTSKHHCLRNFNTLCKDPNHPSAFSNQSPWINHGHASFQRIALNMRTLKVHPNCMAVYIKEGVVHRELRNNFVGSMGHHPGGPWHCPGGARCCRGDARRVNYKGGIAVILVRIVLVALASSSSPPSPPPPTLPLHHQMVVAVTGLLKPY
jgi:hypothetical protein